MHSVGSTDRETLLSDGVGTDGQTPGVEPACCLKTVPTPYQTSSSLTHVPRGLVIMGLRGLFQKVEGRCSCPPLWPDTSSVLRGLTPLG